MNFDGLRSQVLVSHKLKVVRSGIESGTDKKVLFSAFLAEVNYLACCLQTCLHISCTSRCDTYTYDMHNMMYIEYVHI